MTAAQRPMWRSRLKNLLGPSGKAPRKIRGGIFRGIVMELDLATQAQLYLGLYEREIGRRLRRLSEGIRSAINIGAGEGEQTLFFLTRTPAQTVFSFEPDKNAYRQMTANLRLNGFSEHGPRLRLARRCVGSSDNGWTCSLDWLYPALSFPCLVMMDAEGCEADILRGAGKLLRSAQVRWIVETHSARLEEECAALFRQAHHQTAVVSPAWWRIVLPERRPLPHNRWLIATPGRFRTLRGRRTRSPAGTPGPGG